MTKLMLVEDDNNLREIYEARLQAEGYEIVSARDGEEALVVAKEQKPDLIISDVMMPKISGFEMLDILRNTDGLRDVKIIMLTALGQSDDQQRADKLGADRYLVKSQVTLEDIVNVTHELLDDAAAPAAPTEPAKPAEPATPAVAPGPAKASGSSIPVTDAPASLPVAEPPTATAPADDSGVVAAPEPAAQSTATQEAEVEAKIEDFVAGDVTASPPVEPAPEPVAPVTTSSDVAAADDQLVTDAANDLMGVTPADTPAPQPTAIPISTPEPESSGPVPAEPHKTGGERVIEPLTDSGPKKDIEELLALEEAKEPQAQSPAAPQAQVMPATPKSDGKQDKIDPNSIAL